VVQWAVLLPECGRVGDITVRVGTMGDITVTGGTLGDITVAVRISGRYSTGESRTLCWSAE
jgi:hypothetical protein